VISRRAVLAVPLLAACGRRRGGAGFRGYAFVANEDSQAIAAVDLVPGDGARALAEMAEAGAALS